MISGHWTRDRAIGATDFRAYAPRFHGENLALAEALRTVAESRDATAAQVAIARVLSRGDDIVPLVGGRTRKRLGEALVRSS